MPRGNNGGRLFLPLYQYTKHTNGPSYVQTDGDDKDIDLGRAVKFEIL